MPDLACNIFQRDLAHSNVLYQEGKQLVIQYAQSMDPKVKSEYDSKLQDFWHTAEEWTTTYKEKVRSLLEVWSKQAGIGSIEPISVNADGLVTISKFLYLTNPNMTYFPKLISEVSTLQLHSGITDISSLRKVSQELKSNAKMLRADNLLSVGEFETQARGEVAFPSLVEVTDRFTAGSATKIVLNKLQTAEVLRFLNASEVVLPEMKYCRAAQLHKVLHLELPNVTQLGTDPKDRFDCPQAKSFRAPNLKFSCELDLSSAEEVECPALTTLNSGLKLTALRPGTSFRHAFPKLEIISSSRLATQHSIIIDEENKALDAEIKELQRTNQLYLQHPIMYGKAP